MSTSFVRSNQSGDILFFFGVKNSRSDLHFMMRRSSDEGQTWSDPIAVGADPGYFVMNNDRVLQLADGRLLAPMAWIDEVFKEGSVFRTVVYYSDDDGKTWMRSASDLEAPKRGAMEPGLVELKDGRILQIIRTQVGKIYHSYSSDRGATWSPAEPWIIASPEAPATIVRLPDDRLPSCSATRLAWKAANTAANAPCATTTTRSSWTICVIEVDPTKSGIKHAPDSIAAMIIYDKTEQGPAPSPAA